MEIVKRLNPTKNVLRELYLKSGNRCAYPGCGRNILSDNGDFIGQICHIEAAMPGGERFNENQTNEERRSVSNLMIMCYEHHIKTNNVAEYSVERLKEMKKNHEQTFGGVDEKLFKSIADLTEGQSYQYCVSLEKINSVLEWGNSGDDLLDDVSSFNSLLDELRKLSPDTRAVFRLMLERANKDSEILLEEIKEITGVDSILMHSKILEKYKFITLPEWHDSGHPVCYIQEKYGWNIFEHIIDFSRKTPFSLREIIEDLNFTVFDT